MDRDTIIKEIEDVTELFYQQKIKEAYARLQPLLTDISIYVTGIPSEEKQVDILESLKEAMSAMEQQDTTLLADILQYDLLEKL